MGWYGEVDRAGGAESARHGGNVEQIDFAVAGDVHVVAVAGAAGAEVADEHREVGQVHGRVTIQVELGERRVVRGGVDGHAFGVQLRPAPEAAGRRCSRGSSG